MNNADLLVGDDGLGAILEARLPCSEPSPKSLMDFGVSTTQKVTHIPIEYSVVTGEREEDLTGPTDLQLHLHLESAPARVRCGLRVR